MRERYLTQIKDSVPEVDLEDILHDSAFFNPSVTSSVRQAHPEFSQSSYLRMRSLEEAFLIKNYLAGQPDKRRVNQDYLITSHDRSFAIQKLYDLHNKKDYKPETLFTA